MLANVTTFSYQVPVRVTRGILFELLGQSVGDGESARFCGIYREYNGGNYFAFNPERNQHKEMALDLTFLCATLIVW